MPDVLFGISPNVELARQKRRNVMKTRFLTIAVALASVFTAHQAVAKSAKSNTTTVSKKHHKKHMKNKTASIVAPTAKAAPVMS
jgi:hypothetical protein